MRQTWRWFGPPDKVSIADARQAGVEGIVTALHHVPAGSVWTSQEIALRQRQVSFHEDGRPTGLAWEVVESLPVSEAIKTQTGDWKDHVGSYRKSLENLAEAGIETICYNFMPVLDWTRTDLAWTVEAHGGTTMRFDVVDFAAFDIHLLKRAGAAAGFSREIVEEAGERFATMSDARKAELAANVTAGLPGSVETWTIDDLGEQLGRYATIDAHRLRANLVDFLAEVAPLAQRLGLRLCCHPDDPPFPLLGLPRIVSTLSDYLAILDAVDIPANGVTFCTGSLGARPDNDLPAMVRRLAPRIHFAHLRNVTRDSETIPCSFFEDEHLGGQCDMVAVLAAFLDEERRRRDEGRKDAQIPMRPDHGQNILDDLTRGAQPGYPAIGRLKGLAELRGVMAGLARGASADTRFDAVSDMTKRSA